MVAWAGARAAALPGLLRVAYILKPKADHDYLAAAAHCEAGLSTGSSVDLCTCTGSNLRSMRRRGKRRMKDSGNDRTLCLYSSRDSWVFEEIDQALNSDNHRTLCSVNVHDQVLKDSGNDHTLRHHSIHDSCPEFPVFERVDQALKDSSNDRTLCNVNVYDPASEHASCGGQVLKDSGNDRTLCHDSSRESWVFEEMDQTLNSDNDCTLCTVSVQDQVLKDSGNDHTLCRHSIHDSCPEFPVFEGVDQALNDSGNDCTLYCVSVRTSGGDQVQESGNDRTLCPDSIHDSCPEFPVFEVVPPNSQQLEKYGDDFRLGLGEVGHQHLLLQQGDLLASEIVSDKASSAITTAFSS